MKNKKPRFAIQVEPISEVVDVALDRINEESAFRADCSGLSCESCPLRIKVEDEYTGACRVRCGFMYASRGDTELLTKTQKEILACVAIFGRYPLED